MAYYGAMRYRSWRSRGWRSRGWGGDYKPSKYSVLTDLFGDALREIRNSFLSFDEDALDELFSDYGSIHGESAERYARKTFPMWKSGTTNLSGKTMERLVELFPPYLSPEQRFSILQLVLRRHKRYIPSTIVKINIEEPITGFDELQSVLNAMSHDDVLAHLPESVMKAASWLYDDDITAARSMLAEVARLENEMIRSKAYREIELLKITISSGQVKSASYSVEMPAGKLDVVAYTPSACFIATACFGEKAPETVALRNWRDIYLVKKKWGRKFIVWYYNNGEVFAYVVSNNKALKFISKISIGIFSNLVSKLFLVK
jgi:hypothetical protein